MKLKSFGVAIWMSLVLSLVHSRGAEYRRIVIPPDAHPAVRSAAGILARGFNLPDTAINTNSPSAQPEANDLVLITATPDVIRQRLGSPTPIRHDGYAISFRNGGAQIYGVRPRSLLFAAGDLQQWRNRTGGTLVRDPAFAVRSVEYKGDASIAEYVARLGANLIIGRRDGAPTLRGLPEVYSRLGDDARVNLENRSRSAIERARHFAELCRNADVPCYPFIYGNDLRRWSPALYDAVIAAYPSAAGRPASNSWELATLCPSDPATWKVMEAFVKEFVEQARGDGLYVTFWDHYGIHCQCDRCVKSGMNEFPNQLYECVKHFRQALVPSEKTLVVRTWSSGVPHWLGDQWVNAPGYGGFGGSGLSLWGRVIRELPADIVLQTKVYNSDCQPDAPYSPLVGKAGSHPEIVEYQMTGQTTGRYYFPASTVDHTARTMRENLRLVGPEGGVSLFPGGTSQTDYDMLDDIANSINAHAWRELSWQPEKNVDSIWMEWATPIYGEKAARHVVNALKLSESAVNRLFSTLGLGNDTNSGFPSNIRRRETLLKYTNRYYDPQYAKFLEPTKENIRRVVEEKDGCLKLIDAMFRELDQAKPFLKREQVDELTTRFNWLREYGIVSSQLEESLWRYRYLRHLGTMLTTEPEQMKFLAEAYDAVRQHQGRLFQFVPNARFSCYSVPLGQLGRPPSLGNPIPLMQELYRESRRLVEESVGPGFLPEEWRR